MIVDIDYSHLKLSLLVCVYEHQVIWIIMCPISEKRDVFTAFGSDSGMDCESVCVKPVHRSVLYLDLTTGEWTLTDCLFATLYIRSIW